jgi:uncharacterized protein YeaO (DUF488 family)
MIARELRRSRSFEGSCIGAGKVTLLFGEHDIEHNNAVALADYLSAN